MTLLKEKDALNQQTDASLYTLQSQKDAWAQTGIEARLALLDRLIRDFREFMPQWVDACVEAKGVAPQAELKAQEWLSGPYAVLRYMRLLKESLTHVRRSGHPRLHASIVDGVTEVHVFPHSIYDQLLQRNLTMDVLLQAGIGAPELKQLAYEGYDADGPVQGRVALVFGDGSLSALGMNDVLHRLFIKNQVVLYVIDSSCGHMLPLLEQGLQALINLGFVRLLTGAGQESLCSHDGVDEVHVSGSRETYEAVKRNLSNVNLDKPVSATLGAVGPVIIVPGDWSDADMAYQAEVIASTLGFNGGLTASSPHVIIQHNGWQHRAQFIQELREALMLVPPHKAWRPGSSDPQEDLRAAHPRAERLGTGTPEDLSWLLVENVSRLDQKEDCFRQEAWGVIAETGIEAATVPEFIDRAVAFANERLAGDLGATIVVHPGSLRNRDVAAAMRKAIKDLRYGTVAVNCPVGSAYLAGAAPWGSYAGGTAKSGSGKDCVNNALLLPGIEKTVVRAPFRSSPRPLWLNSQVRKAGKVFPRLADFEGAPRFWKVPALAWSALIG